MSGTNTKDYMYEEASQHFITLHKDFMLTSVNFYQT